MTYPPPQGPQEEPARRGPAPVPGSGAAAGPGAPGSTAAAAEDLESYEAWERRSRLVISPVAAPSILGLFGFAGATFMVASNIAGWWGNTVFSPMIMAPFVIFFGGLAQLAAGMWAYRARDAVATAIHGAWGAFWIAWGLMALAVANGLLPVGSLTSQEFGFWWIALAVVSLLGALAAAGTHMGMFAVMGLQGVGAALLAVGFIAALHTITVAGGWALVASAAAAFYTAGAMMLEQAYGGRVILPLGRWSLRGNLPGHVEHRPIGYASGVPGIRPGQ